MSVGIESGLKILTGTYNCNQKPSNRLDLNLWFGVGFDHESVDIYVFSFQELTLVDNVSKNPKPIDTTNFELWNKELISYLNHNRKTPATKLWESRMGGTSLICYIRETLKDQLTNMKTLAVECSRSKTTIKGGLCIRFEIAHISYCFASVHLTADQEVENYLARIEDFHKISNSTFDGGVPFPNHDFVCWVGDINFRVNLPREDIVKLIEAKQYHQILDHDQLSIARRDGLAFTGYHEGNIAFPPSYKYYLGTDNFNLSEPPSKRNPAYPDRILYKCSEKLVLTLSTYYMGHLIESDHKPVTAVFTCHIGDKQTKTLK